jgi:hypothetical protein
MEKKFKILRLVATLWKIIAWILLVLSILGGCGVLVTALVAGNQFSRQGIPGIGVLGSVAGGIGFALVAILAGFLYFVTLFAIAEMIDVALAIEENTRSTAEQLKNIAKG